MKWLCLDTGTVREKGPTNEETSQDWVCLPDETAELIAKHLERALWNEERLFYLQSNL